MNSKRVVRGTGYSRNGAVQATESEVFKLPSTKQQTNAGAPWWFEGDTEICSSCHQSYAYQTGVYCLDCDANVCSVCVQESVFVELLCHGCETARATEKESQ